MKRKFLFVALALCVIVAAGVATYSSIIIKRTLPQISGEIELAGLESPVEVLRDEFGVPHITAESQLDMYRALGFVNAQDRLWQMDLFRRISRGRLAEVFGPAALKLDRKHRVLGFHQLAQRLYLEAGAESKAVCDAYVDGVNQYIENYPGKLPL